MRKLLIITILFFVGHRILAFNMLKSDFKFSKDAKVKHYAMEDKKLTAKEVIIREVICPVDPVQPRSLLPNIQVFVQENQMESCVNIDLGMLSIDIIENGRVIDSFTNDTSISYNAIINLSLIIPIIL